MKKSVFLLGLLTTAVCLTACGSKDFNMTFYEALEAANHSQLQEILDGNENFEQSFDIAGNFAKDGNAIDGNISTTSKQNINNDKSESSVKFTANITTQGETIKANGTLDLKLVDDTIYLNLGTLDLTGNENLAMVDMMIGGFKGQWLSIPMTGLSDVPSSFSYLKDSKALNDKVKEIVKNEESTVYNGKFKQFNGYNAWKFSLDNEKLNELIREYYESMTTGLDLGSGEDAQIEVPEINIKNFEGYLVITGKDKVTTVIESMEMMDNDVVMVANGFAGDDYEINITEGEENLVKIVANKKSGKYDVSITISDAILLNGTVSPKLSKSEIKLDFDAKLTIKAQNEGETDTVVPFKGSWNYKAISDFTVIAPENAMDLTELLGGSLGGMMGATDDFADYGDMESVESGLDTEGLVNNIEENENSEENAEETTENIGGTVENNEVVVENVEEVTEAQ